MPWLPDFVSAVELARRQTRAAGQADPVGQYVKALNAGDADALETVWPGEVVVHDPRVGTVRGHKDLREFVRQSQSLLARYHAGIEQIATTVVPGRAVVELLVHLTVEGRAIEWPVAVVAESWRERSVAFRAYSSLRQVDGRPHLRPPILAPGPAYPGDVVGRYQAALDAGDTEAVVNTFTPDGYYREPNGPPFSHRGARELRSFFTKFFSAGGGIGVQHCALTDDGVRCAVECNYVRWGRHELSPQAGIGVYERSPDGLLAAARVYDDLQLPVKVAT
jgi:limonene-1,2-epoxide hydrolase